MSNNSIKIGVVGAGSWGTTLAFVAKDRGHDVTLWVYEQELLEILKDKHCNIFFLSHLQLEEDLHRRRCTGNTRGCQRNKRCKLE